MARVRILSPQELGDPDLQSLMETSHDKQIGIFGHSPEFLRPYMKFHQTVKHGGQLPFALKELVRLKIADLNECVR